MSALAPGLSSATPAPAPVASPSALPAAPAPAVAPGWVEGYPNLTGYMAGDPNAGSKGWPQGPAHTWSHRPTRMHPSAPRPVEGADFCLACGRAHKVRNCTRKYQPWPPAACHNCGWAGHRENACQSPYIATACASTSLGHRRPATTAVGQGTASTPARLPTLEGTSHTTR